MVSLDQQRCGRDYAARDLRQLPFLIHGRLSKERESVFFREASRLHQNTFGAFDHLALLERRFGVGEFLPQATEGPKSADSHVEDRLDPLLLETVNDIGGNAGFRSGHDGCGVGVIDEHRNWPVGNLCHKKQLLHEIVFWLLNTNDDGVRILAFYGLVDTADIMEEAELMMAGLSEAVLDDRGPNGILVYDQDRQLGSLHALDDDALQQT